jgi:hypothetical protein
MESMTNAAGPGRTLGNAGRKVKISVSINPVLLSALDRYAARAGVTRSAAMERWLSQISHRESVIRLEEETAAYYDALTDDERGDDATWAAAAAAGSRRLEIDGRRSARRRRAT